MSRHASSFKKRRKIFENARVPHGRGCSRALRMSDRRNVLKLHRRKPTIIEQLVNHCRSVSVRAEIDNGLRIKH